MGWNGTGMEWNGMEPGMEWNDNMPSGKACVVYDVADTRHLCHVEPQDTA